MVTVDSIKVLAYQKEYTKISNKYMDTPVFAAGSGNYSIIAANASNVRASGEYSYAEGQDTDALGTASHAEGYDTRASDNYSHAEGHQTFSGGSCSHAEGFNTATYSDYCHTEGYSTVAIGSGSHAEGENTLTTSSRAHAEGDGTAAYGSYSHAEGSGTIYYNVTLTGNNKTYSFTGVAASIFKKGMVIFDPLFKNYSTISSIDETNNSITLNSNLGKLNQRVCQCYYHCASGASSHVEGLNNIANGSYAHAEGNLNVASSTASHAEGYANTASGIRSHAEGSYVVASGQSSHAEGTYTIAKGMNQHVAGKYNVEDLNNTYAEIIGIGTAESSRKNGRTLDWSGNEQLAGSLTLGLGTTDEVTITAA